MNDIFKIIGIGLMGGVLSLIIKEHRKEYAIFVGIVTSLIIISMSFDIIISIVRRFNNISDTIGIDNNYIEVIIKTVGISYVMEFASEILKDAGEAAIASKITLFGKLTILNLAFPLVFDFLEVCINAINSI